MGTDQILDLLRDRDRLLGENKALRERLEAVEEIRRRVADGWCAVPANGYYEAAIWYRPDDDGFAKLTPEVAAVLWPSTETE